MKTKLVVTAAFSRRIEGGEGEERTVKDYGVGDQITDTAEMRAVRETHARHVVAIAADPPEGDPEHEPPAKHASALTGGGSASDKT